MRSVFSRRVDEPVFSEDYGMVKTGEAQDLIDYICLNDDTCQIDKIIFAFTLNGNTYTGVSVMDADDLNNIRNSLDTAIYLMDKNGSIPE
jgi:hypothetical protein